MATIVKALAVLGKQYGVTVKDDEIISYAILDIAGGIAFGSSNVTPASPTASKTYWGTRVSDDQIGRASCRERV